MFGKKKILALVAADFLPFTAGVLLQSDVGNSCGISQAGTSISGMSASEDGTDTTCPPTKGLIKETNSEYLRNMALDTLSESDSNFTTNTGKQMQALALLDDQDLLDQATGYQGNSLVDACELRDAQAIERIL
eukprot:gene272-845_t